MDEFGDAFSRLELAERELRVAELAFSRDVYLLLMGAGSAACERSAAEVCARRAEVAAALRTMRAVLERCRRSIRVL